MFTYFKDLTNPIGEVRSVFDFEPALLGFKNAGALFAAVRFTDNHRETSKAHCMTGCVIDFDNSSATNTTYQDVSHELSDVEHFAYSTFSNSEKCAKWRLFVPYETPIAPTAHVTALCQIIDLMGAPCGIDETSKKVAQAYFLPAYSEVNKGISFCHHHKADKFQPEDINVVESIEYFEKAKPAARGRNATLSAFCSKMYLDGYDFNVIVDELLHFDRTMHNPPYFSDEKEFKTTADNPRMNAVKFALGFARTFKNKSLNSFSVPHRYRKTTEIKKVSKPDFGVEYKYIDYAFLNEIPGLVGEIARDIAAQAIFPQPPLALQAALSIVGLLKGHLYMTERGGRSNIYALGVANTGRGKNDPQVYISNLMMALGLEAMEPGPPASNKGVHEILKSGYCKACIVWDEIGAALRDILNKNGASYLVQIEIELLKLFSRANSHFNTGVTKVTKENKAEPILLQPCLIISGYTTPSTLFEAFKSDNIRSGLVPRFLYFRCPDTAKRNHSYKGMKPRSDIIEKCGEYAQESMLYKSKTEAVAQSANRLGPETKPQAVRFTEEAYNELVKITDEEDRKSGNTDDIKADVHTRIAELIERIALILCCTEKIQLNDIKLATRIVRDCQYNLLVDLNRNMFDSEFVRVVNQVVDLLRGTTGMKESILRKRAKLAPNVFKSVIYHLKESKQIIFRTETSRNNSTFNVVELIADD